MSVNHARQHLARSAGLGTARIGA